MTKIIVVLFVSLVFNSLYTGKAATEKSEEKTDSTENIKSEDDEDESASIQVVHRNVVTDTVDKLLINDDNLQEKQVTEDTEVLKDANSTKAETKYDKFFEDLISDSADDIILENQDENTKEVSISDRTSIEENNGYNDQQEHIEIVIEDITKASNNDQNSQEASSTVNEDENNWRSAEHFHPGIKKYANEAPSVEEDDRDFSVNDYMDKKIDLEVKGRMETRIPEREHINTRLMNARHFGLPEDHDILDSGPMRSFSEIVLPRYRPVLTRSGIVYTPTLLSMQTGSPLLDRLSGHSWVLDRAHIMNQEAEEFSRTRHNKIMGVPHYEDSKMIDDFNDYGSNTYSYTPVKKVATQAPPQQMNVPDKFDVFQKLVEASNHPKKRTFEFPGQYHPQYSEKYGFFDVGRVGRHA